MQFPDAARTCLDGDFLAEYVQIKVKTIIKRLNNAKRQTNYLVCNIEGDRSVSRDGMRGELTVLDSGLMVKRTVVKFSC